jgi:hypothetical protein
MAIHAASMGEDKGNAILREDEVQANAAGLSGVVI